MIRRHGTKVSEIRDLQRQLDVRLTDALNRVGRMAGLPPEPLLRPESRSFIAFVHIPKTAGGTVKAMLTADQSMHRVADSGNFFRFSDDQTARNLRKLKGAARSNDRVIAIGHVPYGVYRSQLPDDVRYVTFLREPVDRVVSHFYRHVMNWDGTQRLKFGGVDSLERALTDTDLPEIRNLQPALNNLQTRCLCSDPSPLGRLPASALDEAKANLREFAFVGIQEQFMESLVLFQRATDLRLRPATDRHVNLYRPTVDDVEESERRLIEEHNQLDVELYRYACALFEEQVEQAGEDLQADVEALRNASAALNQEDQARLEANADWLDQRMPPGTKKLDDSVRQAAAEAGISEREFKRAARYVRNRRQGRDGVRRRVDTAAQ